MRSIVRMVKDVGGNLHGELAGFDVQRANELVSQGAASPVATFDPEFQRFNPETLQVEPRADIETVPPEPVESEIETIPPEQP